MVEFRTVYIILVGDNGVGENRLLRYGLGRIRTRANQILRVLSQIEDMNLGNARLERLQMLVEEVDQMAAVEIHQLLENPLFLDLDPGFSGP